MLVRDADYTRVGEASLTTSKIKMDVTEAIAGEYTCKSEYYNADCTTRRTLDSSPITVTVLEAVAKTNPTGGDVTAGVDQRLSCVFPNPFAEEPAIEWTFNGAILLGDGDYYQDGAIVFSGQITNTPGNNEFTTALEIPAIITAASGSYQV